MITVPMLTRFLAEAHGQALEEGNRYAREARVVDFIGSAESVSTVVRGSGGEYEVALWAEGDAIAKRCSCPSWRDPCKHEVAAALVLRQWLTRDAEKPQATAPGKKSRAGTETSEIEIGPGLTIADPGAARRKAIEERRTAARRERLTVGFAEPPVLLVASASGFEYRVTQRGEAQGPHGCECPDFEANRLHTCKHVERARRFLATRAGRPTAEQRAASGRPRVHLYFGEVVEPRLFGAPRGRGAVAARAAFDRDGVALHPLARDESETLAWLAGLGSWVEPEAIEWLERRVRRRPVLPDAAFRTLLPRLGRKPYRYQWQGAEFLARTGRALLADEMGLGKTVQAILAAAALRAAADPVKHVTVVCPASLRGGWQDEIRLWLGEEATLLEGGAGERARVIASRPPWLITHYEQVVRDHPVHRAHPPDLLVVDEAQRAKGLTTRTARTLKRIDPRYLFALTGTPLENRLEEAYAVAQLIDQRLLPPLWQIERDHFVRKDARRVVLYRNLEALRSRLAPAFLRRRKEDVALELPERLRSIVMVPLHPAVLLTYKDAMQQVAWILRKKVLLPADLDRMQRLLVIARRCCNGPHMLGKPVADREVPKLEELEQALRDLCLGEGRKAVVFSEWTDMTERVEDMARRLRLPVFHLRGDVPVKKRPAMIRAFADAAGPAVFVSTDAGGLGLNLQVADVLINLDLPWNPARLEQRIARVHRIGSRRPVQVVLMVAKGAVEESILHQYDTKRNVLENVWAKDGEDQIAAPGGSGAFRAMIEALLATRGPEDVPVPAADDVGGALEPAVAPVALAAGPTVPLPTEADAHPASAPLPAEAGRAAPGRAPGATPSPSPPPVVDPAALATAIAALAPALPAEHRQSLATVLRVLASALDPAPQGS